MSADQPSIRLDDSRDLPLAPILALYRANGWSAADRPEQLHKALVNSHALCSAWDGPQLVGLGNAVSDGHLVVYYPHLLVLPAYKGLGIGRMLVQRLMAKYDGFHQHVLLAVAEAAGFYERQGFVRAGSTVPMWIYAGGDA